MNPLPPVITTQLFPQERAALLDLLLSLTPAQWEAPTVCPGWCVKDIVAHLLGDDLGKLARGRDSHAPAAFKAATGGDFDRQLLDFINRQNEAWVSAATRRLSTRLLVDLLRWSGSEIQAYFESLDMFATGEPVSWAGPEPAPVWLDVAREFSERWIHQSQVRDAVAAEPLTDPRLFLPLLDTLVRAIPHTLRDTPAPEGTHIRLGVTSLGGEGAPPVSWSIVRRGPRWCLYETVAGEPSTSVRMDGDTAWRLFTKGIGKTEALARTNIEGTSISARKS